MATVHNIPKYTVCSQCGTSTVITQLAAVNNKCPVCGTVLIHSNPAPDATPPIGSVYPRLEPLEHEFKGYNPIQPPPSYGQAAPGPSPNFAAIRPTAVPYQPPNNVYNQIPNHHNGGFQNPYQMPIVPAGGPVFAQPSAPLAFGPPQPYYQHPQPQYSGYQHNYTYTPAAPAPFPGIPAMLPTQPSAPPSEPIPLPAFPTDGSPLYPTLDFGDVPSPSIPVHPTPSFNPNAPIAPTATTSTAQIQVAPTALSTANSKAAAPKRAASSPTPNPLDALARGIDDLFSRITDPVNANSAARKKKPPTSSEAITELPRVAIKAEELTKDNVLCTICREDFQINEELVKLPCSHFFHGNCILPWLTQHNTCPLCRQELPSNDRGYERRKDQTKPTNV